MSINDFYLNKELMSSAVSTPLLIQPKASIIEISASNANQLLGISDNDWQALPTHKQSIILKNLWVYLKSQIVNEVSNRIAENETDEQIISCMTAAVESRLSKFGIKFRPARTIDTVNKYITNAVECVRKLRLVQLDMEPEMMSFDPEQYNISILSHNHIIGYLGLQYKTKRVSIKKIKYKYSVIQKIDANADFSDNKLQYILPDAK